MAIERPRIDFTELFEKQRKSAPFEVRAAFLDALQLFLVVPDHPALRNHALKESYVGYRSIDVTGDYRAIFREAQIAGQRLIIFYYFGTP